MSQSSLFHPRADVPRWSVDKRSYYINVANNLLMYAGLRDALRALGNAGIKVIVLKGAALAGTIYPDTADRLMGDVDLLVRPDDREHAGNTLVAAGYQFLPELKKRFAPFNTNLTGEMSFQGKQGELIDLHWELIPIEWLRRTSNLDTSDLWRNAHVFQLDDVQALQLAPVDLLIHLCAHLVMHNYAHPSGYKDIMQTLNFHHPFPWKKFLCSVAQYKLQVSCYFALDAVNSELKVAVPLQVLDALRPQPWQRWLVQRIADPRKGMSGVLNYSHARSYLLHLATADRLGDVLGVIWWLLFPGPRWLADRYRLRNALQSWLACLWHPFFVLWQGLLSFREVFASNK